MITQDNIQESIYQAIDAINETLPADKQITKTEETVLFDASGAIDSLELTLLIVAIEQKIEQNFSARIVLADETTMSAEHSPFRTIKDLTAHIAQLME